MPALFPPAPLVRLSIVAEMGCREAVPRCFVPLGRRRGLFLPCQGRFDNHPAEFGARIWQDWLFVRVRAEIGVIFGVLFRVGRLKFSCFDIFLKKINA